MSKRLSGPRKRLRKGLWSPEEDMKLMNHVFKYGHGCWSYVPKLAGTYCTNNANPDSSPPIA
jgi:myb proto-oncogene protein